MRRGYHSYFMSGFIDLLFIEFNMRVLKITTKQLSTSLNNTT